MVLTVGSVARRSNAEHWHGTRQKAADRTAADVAASSRPGVSMTTTSKPAAFALATAWATSYDPIATSRGVSVGRSLYQLVADPCGSRSTSSVCRPDTSACTARLVASVVFPTPPFCAASVTTSILSPRMMFHGHAVTRAHGRKVIL